MRSFALTALAFLTLGVFSFAAPTPVTGDRDVTVVANADVPVNVNVRRDDSEDKCLDSILDDVVSAVDSVLEKIDHLEGEVTTAVITPLLKEVKEILNSAIKDVKGLTDLSSNSLLKTVGGLLDIDGVAELLGNVLTVVLHLVKVVLGLVSSVVKDDILSLLCEILNLVGELLSCVLKIVVPIVGDVVGLVLELVDHVLIKIIVDLKITVLIDLLHIKI